MPTPLLLAPLDFQTFRHPCHDGEFRVTRLKFFHTKVFLALKIEEKILNSRAQWLKRVMKIHVTRQKKSTQNFYMALTIEEKILYSLAQWLKRVMKN